MRVLVGLGYVLSGCVVFAPRLGVCTAPQNPAYAAWRVTGGGVGDSDEDVWLSMQGRSGGKPCRVLVETTGCDAWRVRDLTCKSMADEPTL